jgi:hypothetical protein
LWRRQHIITGPKVSVLAGTTRLSSFLYKQHSGAMLCSAVPYVITSRHM